MSCSVMCGIARQLSTITSCPLFRCIGFTSSFSSVGALKFCPTRHAGVWSSSPAAEQLAPLRAVESRPADEFRQIREHFTDVFDEVLAEVRKRRAA